jgi:hypothetical protein
LVAQLIENWSECLHCRELNFVNFNKLKTSDLLIRYDNVCADYCKWDDDNEYQYCHYVYWDYNSTSNTVRHSELDIEIWNLKDTFIFSWSFTDYWHVYMNFSWKLKKKFHSLFSVCFESSNSYNVAFIPLSGLLAQVLGLLPRISIWQNGRLGHSRCRSRLHRRSCPSRGYLRLLLQLKDNLLVYLMIWNFISVHGCLWKVLST